MGVRLAEIRIVVKNRLALAGIVEELHHPSSERGVQRIVGAVDENVIFVDLRHGHVEALLRILLVEGVVGIAVVVQKRERDRTFTVRKTVDVAGGKVVFHHKVADDVADTVIAYFADEGDGYSEAS